MGIGCPAKGGSGRSCLISGTGIWDLYKTAPLLGTSTPPLLLRSSSGEWGSRGGFPPLPLFSQQMSTLDLLQALLLGCGEAPGVLGFMEWVV